MTLSVDDWGGSGRGILFVHPTGFLGAVWKPVITALRRLGFEGRILSFDQRGHGRSSKPDQGYEWENFGADLLALMTSLGLEGMLGVGHSAGATTIACVATAEPKRFRRLVLIDPILFDREMAFIFESTTHPMVERTRTRRLVWSSRAELFESYRRREPYESWTEEALRAYVDFGTFERPDGEVELWCPGRIEAQIYENSTKLDGFDYLKRLARPALVVRGENSGSFLAEKAEKAMRCLDDGRLVTLAGTSHFVPMEVPAQVAELIIAEFDA